MDKTLAKIIKDTLESPNPICPKCKVEGIIKSYGEFAWCKCPKCGQTIGELLAM